MAMQALKGFFCLPPEADAQWGRQATSCSRVPRNRLHIERVRGGPTLSTAGLRATCFEVYPPQHIQEVNSSRSLDSTHMWP